MLHRSVSHRFISLCECSVAVDTTAAGPFCTPYGVSLHAPPSPPLHHAVLDSTRRPSPFSSRPLCYALSFLALSPAPSVTLV